MRSACFASCALSEAPVAAAVGGLARADVALQRVAALHVDEAAAEPVVRAALAARHQGVPVGSDQLDELDLLWYAPQELADLVAGLTPPRR